MTEPRHSTYRATHKAIRHLLFSASHQVGVTDFADDAVTAVTMETVDAIIFALREHRTREDASSILPWRAGCRALQRGLRGTTKKTKRCRRK